MQTHNTIERRRAPASAREKAVLVSVALPGRPFADGEPRAELRGLAETAGARVVGVLPQKRQQIDPATSIGAGKAWALRELVEETGTDVVFSDNDLAPAQVRNLEESVGVRVLDRTEVILDVFAGRAAPPRRGCRSSWPSWNTPCRA